jgi:Holliday junction resolvase
MIEKIPRIKFVKRANCWCVTYWRKGKQKQKWIFDEKEAIATEEAIYKISQSADERDLEDFLEFLEYE